MAKRLTDTDLWKRQRWFRKLSPEYKLVFSYLKDQCDHAGVWKIDCADLIDDTGLDNFDLKDFIKKCNVDFDRLNGSSKHRERVKLIADTGLLWLCGFIQFQYETKEGVVPTLSWPVKSAIQRINGLGLLKEAIHNKYIILSTPIPKTDYLTQNLH